MSINSTPEMRALFARFRVEEVPVTYTLPGMDRPCRANELIVTN